MTELNWFTISSLIFLTIVQHESGVVLWYHLWQGYTETHAMAAVYAFVVVSVIDLIWLYVLWVLTDKSLSGLSHIAWIQRRIDRFRNRRWFMRLSRWFTKPAASVEAGSGDSRFHRMLKQSGYVGIALCAALPGPGLKEIGIIMSLTPRYRRAGFHVMYAGGLVKTVMTMLLYGGLYSMIEKILT